jgi:hypothetical protein
MSNAMTTGSALVDEPDELVALVEVLGWAMPAVRSQPAVFGSPDWLALPADDPERWAAAVVAALVWWRGGTPIEDVEARVRAVEDRMSSLAIASSGPRRIRQPTHAELARRRDWHARRDRPDHRRGPVASWGPQTEGGRAA